MARHAGRSGAAWNRARAQVLKGATHCEICGEPLDFDAPPRSPRSPSVDHVMPLAQMRGMDARTQRRLALDPANLRPVHYGCNASRGAGRGVTRRPARRSREW